MNHQPREHQKMLFLNLVSASQGSFQPLWKSLDPLSIRSARMTSWTPWKLFCSPTCRPRQPEALLSPPPWNWAHVSPITWSKKHFCHSQQTVTRCDKDLFIYSICNSERTKVCSAVSDWSERSVGHDQWIIGSCIVLSKNMFTDKHVPCPHRYLQHISMKASFSS